MGCSNARLLVQTPLSEGNTGTNLNPIHPQNSLSIAANETSPAGLVASSSPTDANNSSTRMHLTGVDLVVERNGSYTLLLTPKTHKQLMPYVLRKKRFRILVDKPRTEETNLPVASYDLSNSERIMESGKELKLAGKKGKKQSKQKMESTIESVQQVASDELDKAKARFIGGRSIDRGDPEDMDENIQSDDEGMIEEIVTTVEEDKDLECKVKKKIETKKTIAQDPETHNKITKVVKTEVTEITRTITINDQHDLERAKRELGIDDVNKLLPSTHTTYNLPSSYHSTSSWIDHPRLTQVQEKYYEPANEIVTSGDFPSDSPVKQHSPNKEVLEQEVQPLAEATTVGRGAVVETISPQPTSTTASSTSKIDEQKSNDKQKKKKKSSLNLCSCTRSNDQDEEQRKQKAATIVEQKSKQKKKASVTTTNAVLTSTNLQTEPVQNQGQALISNEIKQLITEKKSLLIDYIHLKIFRPAKFFSSNDQDSKGRKISSRIVDHLQHDRCSSWNDLLNQMTSEHADQSSTIQPMVKTYEDLFTHQQANLLNTFQTIHREKDLKNLSENPEFISIVQTAKDTVQVTAEQPEKVIDDDHAKQQALINTKELDMNDDIDKPSPIYNEEQLSKVLADISTHKPITLAEAIAYQYIDLEDPKLGLANDTAQRIKNLFRPLPSEDESALNSIRIKRAGQYLADFNLGDNNTFEKFHLSEPFIYQLQQSFEPTLDFNEKQFRLLTDAILNNKEEYSNLQFDIGRTLMPVGDMKESSTNDFSQSDSGYSMTTATYESLAGKARNEFETINEPTVDQHRADETDEKTIETTVQSQRDNLESIAIASETAVVRKDDEPTTVKKRKSPGVFSCFGNKKAKASKGQPTIAVSSANAPTTTQQTTTPIEEKPAIDYAILSDGKRVYIDAFRDRPGLDMSYKPDDFDNRFVLPTVKSAEEYERAITPENSELQLSSTEEQIIDHSEAQTPTASEPVHIQTEIVEEKPVVHLEPRGPIAEPVDVQAEVVEEKPVVHLEPRAATIEPVDVQAETEELKTITHLESRPATIELIDIQVEPSPIVLSLKKDEPSTVSKTTTTTTAAATNLHGAGVDLPEIELVKPGPLPTISITKEKQKKVKEPITSEKPAKVKKSTGGLCASCFGAKAAQKQKKQGASEVAKAPIEPAKVTIEEKVDSPPPTIEITSTPTVDASPLPVLTVTTDQTFTSDIVNEETLEQTAVELSKPEEYIGATIEKLVPAEEPHYQLPSGEPVPSPVVIENEYSVPESNTYDIPRSLETPSVENIQVDTIIKDEIVTPLEIIEVQKSSEPMLVSAEPKIQSTIVTESEVMPNVEVDESKSKGSYTLPKTKSKTKKVKEPKQPKVKEPKVKEPKEAKVKEPKEPKAKGEKKSGLFSNLFRQSDRKSKAPGLDLPAVERDLSPTNELREPHRHDSDPLRVPHADLPKPDITLPNFDRAEVNVSSGHSKQSSEFAIPVVDLPPIPNLQLPSNESPSIDNNVDIMKVPNVTLPDLQFTSNEQESTKLPELNLKSEKIEEKLPELPPLPEIKQEKEDEPLATIETGLALASPVNDMLDIQTSHKDFPIETDYAIKTEASIPELPTDETGITITPELLTTEQKYTITDTHFVPPPELPLTVEKQTTETIEVSSKIPELDFELPSTEPISVISKDTSASPPSFDDDVPTVASKIVPAVEISPVKAKPLEKEAIEAKGELKKKSSTLALCSCFGSKSNAQKDQPKSITATKEKSKTIAAPKADLPDLDMPVLSSNISSTLKTKGALRAPTTDLPPVDLTLPQSEPVGVPATTGTKEKKRKAPKKPSKAEKAAAAATSSPEVVLTTPVIVKETVEIEQTTITIPTIEVSKEETPQVSSLVEEESLSFPARSPTPPPVVIDKQSDETIDVSQATPSPVIEAPSIQQIQLQSTSAVEKQPIEEIKETPRESKKSPAFEIKAPALDIPSLDLSGPSQSDAYIKHEEPIISQSRSDSGLEAIISSHLQPSSTFSTNQTIDGLNQHASITSGLGSATISKTSTQPEITSERPPELTRELSILRHDFARKITMNDDLRAKLIFRQNDLKKCLETEIAESVEDFDAKKDHKSLNKVLNHAIDLINKKKVSTYPELKQRLILDHKNDAFIVDPVVRSLYCTIEKQGLDNIDKPEFAIAIRDMVRLPAKQTLETVSSVNKESTDDKPVPITPEATTARSSWLSCGRSKPKSKPTVITTPTTGLLDERRRLQLNTHRNELTTILRDHMQASQPPIRQFAEHPKEVEKILRKSLTSVVQPKTVSYEQIRNDLKTENKQTFYLVDPIVDIIRDTFDHCDISQMNEKTNLDILDSNISQTAQLYNQTANQTNLLSTAEYDLLKSNQLTWLNQHLVDAEAKDKKSTRKQNRELSKILTRAFDLLSSNLIYTWDELSSQLRREFPKAQNLCDRAVELIKQAQRDGLLLTNQSPTSAQQDITSINVINTNGKRRPSSLITDRARQNLKSNRKKIVAAIANLIFEYNKPLYTEQQIETYVNKTLHYLEHQKTGQFQTYNDLKDKLKKDYKRNHEKLIEQIVDVIEQVHASNQFDDLEKAEVQTLMRDRLEGKPLVLKEMYVSLPPRVGAYGTSKYDESSRYLSTSVNGDQTFNSSSSSHRIGRGLSWREANERARILFYRGKHPAIHYDEQAAAFDVRMLLETTTGGTQEIPVTDSDVHELLNSCGVQWDGVNIISLVDHSEDVVRAAEQAALKVIREKGLVDVRTPPSTTHPDDIDESSS